MSPLARPPRRVLILAAAPAQLLDIAGPAEILTQANRLGGGGLYHLACHIVPEPGSPATTAGLALGSTIEVSDLEAWPTLDTLIVAGGEERAAAAASQSSATSRAAWRAGRGGSSGSAPARSS
ncbi:hypothetical protein [Methylobacterium gregans]|uniref:hypothetical protein n=1 Tax=Methylobacterium gregans TaxID=374424 RepID=UPI0036130AFA